MKMYLFFLLLVISSCVALKPLKMKRMDNLTNKLKLNGYYISCGDSNDTSLYEVLILYNNGVLINYADRMQDDCVRENDLYLKRKDIKLTELPYFLGVYAIKAENAIFTERWYSTDYYYPTVQHFGKIVNDSTFYLKYEESGNHFFRFVPFSPKPDSTNKFIK